VLSSLLTSNFNALFIAIQGLLRKPRLPLTANSLSDFSSTVFYEKISGIPAYTYLWVMVRDMRVEEIQSRPEILVILR